MATGPGPVVADGTVGHLLIALGHEGLLFLARVAVGLVQFGRWVGPSGRLRPHVGQGARRVGVSGQGGQLDPGDRLDALGHMAGAVDALRRPHGAGFAGPSC